MDAFFNSLKEYLGEFYFLYRDVFESPGRDKIKVSRIFKMAILNNHVGFIRRILHEYNPDEDVLNDCLLDADMNPGILEILNSLGARYPDDWVCDIKDLNGDEDMIGCVIEMGGSFFYNRDLILWALSKEERKGIIEFARDEYDEYALIESMIPNLDDKKRRVLVSIGFWHECLEYEDYLDLLGDIHKKNPRYCSGNDQGRFRRIVNNRCTRKHIFGEDTRFIFD